MQSLRLDRLALVNVVFLVTLVLHDSDHVRQGLGRLTPEVMTAGLLLVAAAFATLPLTLRQHPRAPLAAAVVGLLTAIAIVAGHLLPHWSAFSDPYPDLSLDTYSWAVMLAELVAAVIFGLVGVDELRRRSAVMAPSAERSTA